MNAADSRCLVTGAGGFIGSHLVERLVADGHEVRALVTYRSDGTRGWLEESPVKDSVEIVAGDIRDPERTARLAIGCDRIFHLAALVAIPHSYASPNDYVEVNIRGSLNVLNAARTTGARVLQMSTSEVYGTAQEEPQSERHPLSAQSPYAASKIGAEQISLSFHRSFGTVVVVVRPFNTYGPRQSARAVVPNLMLQLLRGRQTLCVSGLGIRRDFTFVTDTVDGLIRCMDRGEAGQIYNLGAGVAISLADLATEVGVTAGRKWTTVAESAEYARPPDSEVLALRSDNSRAVAALGWAPKTVLSAGLRQTWEWMREHDDLYPKKAGRVL